MMARLAAWGVGLLATLAVPAVLALLARLHGTDALLALPPAEMAVLLMSLFLPASLLLLVVAGLTQRVELVALRNAVLRQSTSFDTKTLATETLIEECRSQTALLQEQVQLKQTVLAVLDAVEPLATARLCGADLARLGLQPGDALTVASRRGRVTLHARRDFDPNARRGLRRVTIKGDKPVYLHYEQAFEAAREFAKKL